MPSRWSSGTADANPNRPCRRQNKVVAVLPSVGLGGGIEHYAQVVCEDIVQLGYEVSTFTFLTPAKPSPSWSRKALYVWKLLGSVRLRGRVSKVLIFHPNLCLPGLLSAWLIGLSRSDIRVFAYGQDIWAASRSTKLLFRFAGIVVTISAFSAGALVGVTQPRLLAPRTKSDLAAALLAIPERVHAPGEPANILSVFSLKAFREKGLSELVGAVAQARRSMPEIRLTVAGRGPLPSEAKSLVEEDWITVIESPSPNELIAAYASGSLFVLATRFSTGRERPSGEGFGFVLEEAALAGLPVIGPACDGSRDAFVPGVTGLCPADESVSALTKAIIDMVSDPANLKSMAEWSRSLARARMERAGAGTVAEVLGLERHSSWSQ